MPAARRPTSSSQPLGRSRDHIVGSGERQSHDGGDSGAALVQKLLNWAQKFALWGSLAAVLVGASMYGLAGGAAATSNASKDRGLALGGVVAAVLAGVAPASVNLSFPRRPRREPDVGSIMSSAAGGPRGRARRPTSGGGARHGR